MIHARSRLAWFGPLNPDPSGISDYGEEILPHLEELWEPDLFVYGYRPTAPALSHLRVVDCAVADPVPLLPDYDAVLYHMGNSPSHEYVYDTLLRWPGLVVQHEWAIPHLLVHRSVARGRPHLYLQEMRWQHGDAAAERARRHLWGAESAPWDTEPLRYPLNRRVLEEGTGFLVHSRFLAGLVTQSRPDAVVHHVEMHAAPPPRWAGRSSGRGPFDVVFATAGNPGPTKRVDVILRALARLRDRVSFRYDLLGTADDALEELVSALGLELRVRLERRPSLAALYERLLASDVCIFLRHPTLGETSAVVMRALACGRPVVVSSTGWFDELPDEVAVKIPVDPEREEDALAEALERLAGDPSLRRRMGEAAHRYAAERDPRSRAKGYHEFLCASATRPRSAPGRLAVEVGECARELGLEGSRVAFDALRVAGDLVAAAGLPGSSRATQSDR